MVQMIPSKLGEVESEAEEDLYLALAAMEDRADWLVIHSQDLAKVRGKTQSEVDFIVIVPKRGVVVIECKGARSATVDGSDWTIEGVPPAKRHVNPFTQADEAIRSLRGLLKHAGVAKLDSTPFARLVWFPKLVASQFTQTGTEYQVSEIALKPELADPAAAILRALDEQLKSKQGDKVIKYTPAQFGVADAQVFARTVRTSLDFTANPESEAADRKVKVREATEEQKLTVDMLIRNNVLFLEGEAGTGKTVILTELARRWAKEGRRVLYVCYNELLAESINREIGGHQSIDVYSANELLLSITGLAKNPGGSVEAWYSEQLPQMVLNKTQPPGFKGKYEAICFDEFQDITTRPMIFDAVLSLIDAERMAVKFAFAADDSQQIQTNGYFVDSHQFVLDRTPFCAHVTLTTNCRQAPKLTNAINELLNRQTSITAHRLSKNTDAALEVIATTSEREPKDLKKVLERLSKTYPANSIRVLSPRNKESVLGRLSRSANIHSGELRALKSETDFPKFGGKYHWRSIPKYKGLEDDVVVITDVSQANLKWLQSTGQTLDRYLYVGLSRARFHAILLVQDNLLTATHETSGVKTRK